MPKGRFSQALSTPFSCSEPRPGGLGEVGQRRPVTSLPGLGLQSHSPV